MRICNKNGDLFKKIPCDLALISIKSSNVKLMPPSYITKFLYKTFSLKYFVSKIKICNALFCTSGIYSVRAYVRMCMCVCMYEYNK